MSSSKTQQIDSRQSDLVKARLSYSGGFKYPQKPRYTATAFESAEDIPSEDQILKMFGVTKPNAQIDLLPNRNHMPESKVQLIEELVGNIDHKLEKMRMHREKMMGESRRSHGRTF